MLATLKPFQETHICAGKTPIYISTPLTQAPLAASEVSHANMALTELSKATGEAQLPEVTSTCGLTQITADTVGVWYGMHTSKGNSEILTWRAQFV